MTSKTLPPRDGGKVDMERARRSMIKVLSAKFGYEPDLRSGIPEHYCNVCGLGGETFWLHPTPTTTVFKDFSWQLKIKLDQPKLICSECAFDYFQ
jgi:hypothetical protein